MKLTKFFWSRINTRFGVLLSLFIAVSFASTYVLVPRDFIEVRSQPIGEAFKIKRVKLTKPGFVVFELLEEERKTFYGHSDYLPAGLYNDINLDTYFMKRERPAKPGDSVVVSLYEDNGDTFFDQSLDKPLRNLWGREIKRIIRLEAQVLGFDLEKEIENVRRILDREGTVQAYDYFREVDEGYKDGRAHFLAHFIGAELYKREGTKGVSYCDEAAFYGCYHGFFGHAFSEEEKNFVKEAEQLCRSFILSEPPRYANCIHGMGHGLLAFAGYKTQNLLDALIKCDSLGAEYQARNICYSGVFMEYNLSTMKGTGEEFIVREFNSSKPLEPCNALPERYQPECYLEQPVFWSNSVGEDYAWMGRVCSTVQRTLNRERCFQGIALALLNKTYFSDLEAAKQVCRGMPTEEGRAACATFAASQLLSEENRAPLALCDMLSTELKEKCKKESLDFLCEYRLICQ